MKINKERVTAATANLLICHCVLEKDRIPLVEGYGQALERRLLLYR